MSKRLFFLFVLVSMFELAQAQTPPSYEPYWSVEYQMGFINVNGEGNFFRMTSPSFSFNAEYRFSEPLGVRAVLGGFQGKGYVVHGPEFFYFVFALYFFQEEFLKPDVLEIAGHIPDWNVV